MIRAEGGEVSVRILDNVSTVSVQVLWRGAELNLLRSKEEPVERFVQRLGISCQKQVGGPDRKKAKKDKKKPPVTDGNGRPPESPNAGFAVRLLDDDGARIADGVHVVEALRRAKHIEIEGEKLAILVNPPAIRKLEVFGKPLIGCPLLANLQCEFCDPEAFHLRWVEQVTAGGKPSGSSGGANGNCIGEGRILWVPETCAGRTLLLRAEIPDTAGNARAVQRVGIAEEVPTGWPERRLASFGSRVDSERRFRVVCYNILAAQYAKTQTACREMYPYCPPSALDFSYRQPVLGRELARLDADIVCLQECAYTTATKFLHPLFGDRYHMRVSLKASKISEGCVLLVRKEKFEVLEERDFLFRELFPSSPAFAAAFRQVRAKWPDFVSGVLPHMSTVFQLSVLRHTATGELIVVANTHLFYHPFARHIRLLQVMCMLQQVHDLRVRHGSGGVLPHVVFCGDLNSTPDQAAIQLLLEGEVSSDHLDWEHAAEFRWEREEEAVSDVAEDEADEQLQAPTGSAVASSASVKADDDAVADPGAEPPVQQSPLDEGQLGMGIALRNPLGALQNAYAESPMPFTNYVNDFAGTLDYILLAGSIRSTKVLPGVTEEDLRPLVGLPNVLQPSDHLCIAADLELTKTAAVSAL